MKRHELEYEVKALTGRCESLEQSVWRLEHPPKFKRGDKVTTLPYIDPLSGRELIQEDTAPRTVVDIVFVADDWGNYWEYTLWDGEDSTKKAKEDRVVSTRKK